MQILDGATGISTSTGMAAANPHSPLVGPAAVTTARGMVAFLESERDQNATDLNGDGDALDHVLRVFDLAGTEITPSATLLGDSFPAVGRQPVAIVGDLVFYREPVAGVSLLNYSYAGQHADPGEGSIAVSPNGQWIVGTGRLDSIIRFNRRDPETGGLKDNSSYSNGDEGFSGLGGASGVVFGPDSNFFYVAGSSDNAVNVGSINGLYPQDENVILLSAIDVEVDGVGGVDGLTGVTRLAISPAGDHLYAAGTGEDAIAVFSRNAGTGALAFVAALFNGAGAGSDLDEPRGLAVSPDGKHVYVAAHASSAVTAFTRNLMTGELTFLASYPDGGLGGPSLAGAREVVVSSDGMNVYVAADTDSAVSVFGRDAVTGGLTFLEAKVEGVSGVSGIAAVQSLAIAPDARTVYAGGDASGFAVFERVTPGGALSFVEAEDVNFLPFTPTRSLAMSPDSEHLYAFYDAAPNAYLYGWERNGRLRTFDTMTGMPRPGLGAEPASLAAAAAGRAVFLSPEGNSGGTNRNGDSDTDDRLVYAYDAATDTVTQLTNVSAFAADRVALSAQVLALEIPEGSQTPPVDLDGNGQFNSVVGVVPTSALVSPPQIVPVNVSTLSGVPIGIAATDVCSSGSSTGDACQTDGDCPGGTCQGVVVFGAGEGVRVGFGFVGTDLNGDGDIHDDVPGIYRTATGQVTFVPQSLMDFVVGGNLIAFRSSENDEGDLNGDGDTLDAVLFVYDLKHDRLINTRQSVVVCDLPGCSPGQEYKVLRDSVAFLTRESDQGDQDLDGDGSATGIVAQIFNVRSAHRKAFSTRAGAPNLPPLPDDFIGQPIVYQERDESVEGIDLNGDGDTDDGIVNVITGDNDGDGVFNEDDTCVEAQDDAALDSDLDGLGDVCDPNPYCSTLTPANPPVAPLANEKCQKALGKAVRGYLTARANTIRGCLGAITKGKLAGRAAVTCRGSLFAGQEVTPADAKTASKLAKARLKLDKTIAGKCTTGDLGALDPCATSVADVQRCLADRITSGVETMLALAYGDVAAIADKATLKCQSAIGSAAVGYLKTAVGAMVRCLDARNAGKISGDGQSLCLGA
ncbi:MAG: beta-propeller fold lactonase family protein, partial [Deltaproteobacteria bacterium]|nr:beta-propeller fold lactonase family protein [Deltaproteobacteria bacterium]